MENQEYNRRWRQNKPGHSTRRYRRMRNERPEVVKAHNALNNAIRDGIIQRQPCTVCGDRRSRGHHDDYSKPLDVLWVCELHHKQIHPAIRSQR